MPLLLSFIILVSLLLLVDVLLLLLLTALSELNLLGLFLERFLSTLFLFGVFRLFSLSILWLLRFWARLSFGALLLALFLRGACRLCSLSILWLFGSVLSHLFFLSGRPWKWKMKWETGHDQDILWKCLGQIARDRRSALLFFTRRLQGTLKTT